MTASGLILDLYDDLARGSFSQEVGGESNVAPLVKTAHLLSTEELSLLPNDAFALVLMDGENSLRKFACTDPGNTAASVLYFLQMRDKLSEDARKIASSNLCQFCEWYGLDTPEELKKEALSAGTVLGLALNAPFMVGQAKEIARKGKIGLSSQGVVHTPEEFKGAEVSYTATMPAAATKTPALPPLASGKKIASECSARVPEPKVVKKASSRFALRDRYPIDDLVQIKTASSYFDEHFTFLSPADRREYAQSLTGRMEEVGLEVTSDLLAKYASSGFGDLDEVEMCLESRRPLVDELGNQILSSLMEKAASITDPMNPDVFRQALEEFDKDYKLGDYYDRFVPDPYFTTYGVKTAEFLEVIGNETITEDRLKQLASPGSPRLHIVKEQFGDDFLKEFRKEPISIFKSLPREQKVVLMRLANGNAPCTGDI